MAASQSGPASGSLDTFPRLLLNHARVRGDRPATREKFLGIWQTWSWSQVAQEVRAMAVDGRDDKRIVDLVVELLKFIYLED